MKIVKKIKETSKYIITGLTTLLYALFFNVLTVHATNIESSKFYTGTKKLIEDSTKALLILAPIITVIMVIYFFVRRGMCDEMDTKKWNSRIIAAIVCGIGAVSASLLVNLFSAYYS